MGRTNPTFRDVLRAIEEQWQPYRRALRREDQRRFDRLVAHARTHADAAGNLNHESPVVPVLVSVALAQARRIDDLETRVEALAADRESAAADPVGRDPVGPDAAGRDASRVDAPD